MLADNYYQGWVARIGGEEVPILRVNHTMRGVVLPAGDHEVVFTYEPADLYLGFYIFITGMVLLAGYGLYLLAGVIRTRRATPAVA